MQTWVDAFFAEARLADVKRQVQQVDLPVYSPFSRANGTLRLISTFDTAIIFQQHHDALQNAGTLTSLLGGPS